MQQFDISPHFILILKEPATYSIWKIMKKLLQGALLPFVIFTSGVLLIGCDQQPRQDNTEQTNTADSDTEQNDQIDAKNADQVESRQDQSNDNNSNHSDTESTYTQADLKSGNMFYIARDVANMQMKTGDIVEKLQQTQTDLQQAIEVKDQQQLQQTATALSRQLRNFNETLTSLDLKSQEIDSIRQQVIQANKQVLNSSFLNGQIDISKVDFNKIEKQMNNIQTDMLKLAAMLIPAGDSSSHSQDEK